MGQLPLGPCPEAPRRLSAPLGLPTSGLGRHGPGRLEFHFCFGGLSHMRSSRYPHPSSPPVSQQVFFCLPNLDFGKNMEPHLERNGKEQGPVCPLGPHPQFGRGQGGGGRGGVTPGSPSASLLAASVFFYSLGCQSPPRVVVRRKTQKTTEQMAELWWMLLGATPPP